MNLLLLSSLLSLSPVLYSSSPSLSLIVLWCTLITQILVSKGILKEQPVFQCWYTSFITLIYNASLPYISHSLSPFSIYSLALIHSHSISLSYSPLLPPGLRWSGAGFVALACWRLNATPDECSWCALQFVSGWSPNLSMHSKMAWNLTLNHLYSSPTLILMDCIPSGSTLIPAHWCLLNTNQHLVFHGIFP